MANSFLGTPPIWIIDTASATPVTNDQIAVKYMMWISPTAVAGDSLVVTDKNGKIIWNPTAPGSNFESDQIHFPDKGFYFQGLIVSTLSSGRVVIYLR